MNQIYSITSVSAQGKPLKFKTSTIEQSKYVDFDLVLPSVQKVIIEYQ